MIAALAGLLVFVAMAWAVGRKTAPLNRRALAWGVALQLIMGLIVFRTGVGDSVLLAVNDAVAGMIAAAGAGPVFLFGELANPAATGAAGLGFLLFFQGLASIVVISVFVQLLYHAGVMSLLLTLLSRVFTRLMRISGVEALAASANVFVGNESILAVRPFLRTMTASELCVLMTACMATVSANMMGAYVAVLGGAFPGIAGHLASASLLSAPAALAASKLVWPEAGRPETLGLNVKPHVEHAPNVVSAIISGAEAGGKLILGISLLLVAVVGLLGMLDHVIGWLGNEANALTGGTAAWSVTGFLSLAFKPFAWLMGVPWSEAGAVGELLGIRMVATEMGAYPRLAEMLAAGDVSRRTGIIAAYCLCGFAHIPAVAITAGGISALVPERRSELASIAPYAFIAATLACLMTGCVAGIFADGGQAGLLLGR